jgi:Ni/Co efflux regulator RcnB
LRLLVAAALLAASALASAQSGARETAASLVALLSEGRIEEAAALSNHPQRRREVLEDYRARVGEEEFRRVYSRYRQGRIVDEIVEGKHRLVIWDLGHVAGQYFVEVDGRYLLDDEPSEARSKLRRALADYRKARASGRKD